jgi:hypothetical protein
MSNPPSRPTPRADNHQQSKNALAMGRYKVVLLITTLGLLCPLYVWARLRFPRHGRDFYSDLTLVALAGLALNLLGLCLVFFVPKRVTLVVLNILGIAWTLAMEFLGPIP